MAVEYPSNAATVLPIAPLDPNAVKRVDVDITDWLDGASFSAQTWSAPTNITIGDGVSTKTTPNGTATPAAPTESSGVLTAFVFSESAAAANRRYVITVSVKASDGKETDRSLGFVLAER